MLENFYNCNQMLMRIKFFIIITVISVAPMAWAATSVPSDYISANTYNNLYPYMNNTMRTQLNPGTNPSQSNAQINVLTRTNTAPNTATRRVVSRTPTTSARAGTTASAARAGTTSGTTSRGVSARRATTTSNARVATATSAGTARSGTTSSRRVVARSGTASTNMVAASGATRSSRGDASTNANIKSGNTSALVYNGNAVSSARCMADYIDCMNDYCERADTEYNRCYCSSKLAQIDAKYKPEIDKLIYELIAASGTNIWTDAEMNEYWDEIIGKYTGDNSWENLESALDIDWAGTESSVRGQQSFAIGHSYCSQHLRACSYMSNNLRDAYRSEISRDCATYESSLVRLKTALESLVEAAK